MGGSIPQNEFINQVYLMQHNETQFMLVFIKYYVASVKDSIIASMQKNEAKTLAAVREEEYLLNEGFKGIKQQMSSEASISKLRIAPALDRDVDLTTSIADDAVELEGTPESLRLTDLLSEIRMMKAENDISFSALDDELSEVQGNVGTQHSTGQDEWEDKALTDLVIGIRKLKNENRKKLNMISQVVRTLMKRNVRP